jgi:hypothetical protein
MDLRDAEGFFEWRGIRHHSVIEDYSGAARVAGIFEQVRRPQNHHAR